MTTSEKEPTPEFEQACLGIIRQWRSGKKDESSSAHALMQLMRDAQAEGNKANQGRAYSALSFLYNNRGKFDKSLGYAKFAQRLFTELDNQSRLAGILISMGEIHRIKGDFNQASNMYEQGLVAAKKAGHQVNTMFATGNYGHVALAAGKYEKAHELLEETLDMLSIYLDPDNPEGKTWMVPPRAVLCEYQSALAETYFYLGEYDKSWEAIIGSYDIAMSLDRKLEMALVYRIVGQLITAQPHHNYAQFPHDAHYYFNNSYVLFEENNADGDAVFTRYIYAQRLIDTGETEKAKDYLEKTIKQFTKLGMMKLTRDAIELLRRL